MTALSVSLVITVRDEAASIAALLASIAAQARPPDEVIVVDGGSTDATVAILEAWQGRLPLHILSRPGANISVGRNAGIAVARGSLIAVTDAGVRLAPDWLTRLVAPFSDGSLSTTPEVVAGFFRPDPRTPFEVAMGATVLPVVGEIDPATFLPSSRSIAFQRAAWERAGGYPEWLDFCEDLVFDLHLREVGGSFTFAPEAIAHFRPRGSLRAFWHQYFRYARGDGKAGLFARRHTIRYVTYAGLLCFMLGGWRWWPLRWAFILGGAAYLRTPYARLFPSWATLSPRERATTAVLIPIIRLVGDCAKMAGYPVGLLWRWRRYGRSRNWRNIT